MYKNESNNQNIQTEKKISESKIQVAQILEHKNQKFISDLKRNPQATVKFQYSKFSPFGRFIKQEKTKQPDSLLDVVAFIQTNLIKIYVEQGNKKAISEFFRRSHNKKQIHIDTNEIEEYLLRKVTDLQISNITMAMILEHTGQNTKALEKWKQLMSEEGARKTVQILRKKDIV